MANFKSHVRDATEKTIDKSEARVINYVVGVFRKFAESDGDNVVRRKHFKQIFNESESRVKRFIEKKYDDFASFVAAHDTIFQESKRGLSFRVAPLDEVLRYISKTTEAPSNRFNEEELLAVSYFTKKIEAYATVNGYFFVRKETVHNFYQHSPGRIRNVVDGNYDSFDDFLDTHSSSFPRAAKGQHFKVKEQNLLDEPRSREEWREIIDQNVWKRPDSRERQDTSRDWKRTDSRERLDSSRDWKQYYGQEKATSDGNEDNETLDESERLREAVLHFWHNLRVLLNRKGFDYIEKSVFKEEIFEDTDPRIVKYIYQRYKTFESFLNVHKEIFVESRSGRSVKVSSGQEVLNYLDRVQSSSPIDGVENKAVAYFVNKIKEFTLQNNGDCVTYEDLLNFYKECPARIKREVDLQYQNFPDFLRANSSKQFNFKEGNSSTAAQWKSEDIATFENDVDYDLDENERLKEAILHFSHNLRVLINTDGVEYILKSAFENDIYIDSDPRIKKFVRQKYGTLDAFLQAHQNIFVESRSGKSVKVSSNHEVHTYLCTLVPRVTSAIDPVISSPENKIKTVVENTCLIDLEEIVLSKEPEATEKDRNQAVAYFEKKVKELGSLKKCRYVTREDMMKLFQASPHNIKKEVNEKYDGFQDFLRANPTSFPSINNGQHFHTQDHQGIFVDPRSEQSDEVLFKYEVIVKDKLAVKFEATSDKGPVISPNRSKAVVYFQKKIKEFGSLNKCHYVTREDTMKLFQASPPNIKKEVNEKYEGFQDFLRANPTSFPSSSNGQHFQTQCKCCSPENKIKTVVENTRLIDLEEIIFSKESEATEKDQLWDNYLRDSIEATSCFSFLSVEDEIEESVYDLLSKVIRASSHNEKSILVTREHKKCQTECSGDIQSLKLYH